MNIKRIKRKTRAANHDPNPNPESFTLIRCSRNDALGRLMAAAQRKEEAATQAHDAAFDFREAAISFLGEHCSGMLRDVIRNLPDSQFNRIIWDLASMPDESDALDL
jgi:hypothetical protein